VRWGAAILHNGVIVPGVFTEEQYNSALCIHSFGVFWFCEIIKMLLAFCSCGRGTREQAVKCKYK